MPAFAGMTVRVNPAAQPPNDPPPRQVPLPAGTASGRAAEIGRLPSSLRHPSEGWGPCCRRAATESAWMPAFAGMTGKSSAQPLQRGAVALGVGGLLGMVGARLLHRLGLGPLDEAGVGEPARQRVPLLLRRLRRFLEPRLLGGDVDDAFERENV